MTYDVPQFNADLQEPYAWPGGYPRYFITSDGCALSYEAARNHADEIRETIRDGDRRSGWCVVACEINWEDAELTCDHTNNPIPSAYADADKD